MGDGTSPLAAAASRLLQHSRARLGARRTSADTRCTGGWPKSVEQLPDETAAEAREADLIAALRPAFNAATTFAGRLALPPDGAGERLVECDVELPGLAEGEWEDGAVLAHADLQ
jgi:hypothetical protein